MVAAWYPGEEGSEALASLLFGDSNFTARLPVTFPKHTGQLPLCYDDTFSNYGFYHCPGTPEQPGRDYVFIDTMPQFEFGHGIGYSKLDYRSINAEYTDEGINIPVEIKNDGGFDAVETVLVYIRDEIASIPQPVKKLVGVKKAEIKAGKTVKVSLTVSKEQLMFSDMYMNKVFENGWFTVMSDKLSTRIYI